MRAFELTGRFGIDALSLADRPEPTPGHGQVLVKVRAVSLNYRDLLVVKGAYSRKLPFPLVPCSDCSGDVVSVGEGVARVKVGDRVAAAFFQTWIGGELTEQKAGSALGGAIDGVLAEYVVLHEDGLVRIPEHLSHEEAATLPCAGVTAWNALVTSGNLKAGDTVLVLGTGGVSLFALQFAGLVGARVIITSSSDAKLERARQLGAADVINYRAVAEWNERARGLTGGTGVDHVVEVGGAGTLAKSLRAVKIGGTISFIGVLAGQADVSLLPVIMKQVRVQGIYVGSRDMFEAMNRAIAFHKLKPVIDRVFPFKEAPDALRHMESGAHFGKVCIRV
jgi:NADPH:quinone reductase-like Zn-dependent oxidoreductase